jgi:transcriptional regulator with XRE-family HTH domain
MGHKNLIKNHSLGTRLKTLRTERNLSQKELAALAGLSANSVSLIERDGISPNVATLQSLAAALNVKMSFFFDENTKKQIIHSKSHDRPYIKSYGVKIEGIGERMDQQEIEPFLIHLDPHSGSGDREVIHAGHEIVYCMQGCIEYTIDGDQFLLEEGDFLLFEAHLPHMWINPRDERAQFVLMIQTSKDSNELVQRHFSNYPSLRHIG